MTHEDHWTFLARPTKGGHKYFVHAMQSVGVLSMLVYEDTGKRTGEEGSMSFLDVSAKTPAEIYLLDGKVLIRLPTRDMLVGGRKSAMFPDSIADLAWLIYQGHINPMHVVVEESLRDVVTVASAVMAVCDMDSVKTYTEPKRKRTA